MWFYEVVVGETEANRCFEIFPLLAECQSQPGQPAHVKTSRGIQPFCVAGRDQLIRGLASDNLLFCRHEFRRAVAPVILFASLP
jgi:hypothetical protein